MLIETCLSMPTQTLVSTVYYKYKLLGNLPIILVNIKKQKRININFLKPFGYFFILIY
jgi:hypothetical protein